MKRLLTGIILWLAFAAGAAAQVAPATLPANSVWGRLGISAGPGQAIPFTILTNNLLLTFGCTTTGTFPVYNASTQTWACSSAPSVTLANPSASIGLSAVNGSATTAMRSDGAPALSQAIVPTWTGLHTFSNGIIASNVSSQTITYGSETSYVPFQITFNAAKASNPEIGQYININSSTGASGTSANFKLGQGVVIAGSSGSSDIYGLNTVVAGLSGFPAATQSLVGVEIDWLNSSGTHYDGGFVFPYGIGQLITSGASTGRGFAAFVVDGQVAVWNRAIYIGNAVRTNAIEDTSNSTTGILMSGNKTTGISITGTISGNAWSSPSATISGAGVATVVTAKLSGTSNQLVFQSAGVTGTISWAPSSTNKTITLPNGTTDFTATGGASQVVKQTSSGGALTVARLACADLSDSGTGCSGTSAIVIGTTAITSGTNTRILYDNSGVVGEYTITGTGTVVAMQTSPAFLASIALSGNNSVAAWTTSGVRAKISAASYTDTSSSGTVATAYTDLWGASTILASSSTTYTNYFGSYFVDPVASTNVTMTNKWSVGADSLRIGTATQFTVSTAGVVTVNNATDAASTTAGGAMTIAGGLAVTKQMFVGGVFTIASSADTGFHLITAGGATSEDWLIQVLSSDGRFRWYDLTGTAADVLNMFKSGGACFGSGCANPGLTNLGVLGTITITGLATDATHTDRTVCQDTTSKTLFFGSGAAGICLGTSSARFKNIDGEVAQGLEIIEQLRPTRYRYKDEYGDPSRTHYGFIAEDIARVMPEMAVRGADGLVSSFDWPGMIAVAVHGIQQLKADNDNLRAEIEILKHANGR